MPEDDKNKKGFAGLAGLVSRVEDVEETPHASVAQHSAQKTTNQITSESEPKTTNAASYNENSNNGGHSDSGGKWLIGIIVAIVIWFIYQADNDSKYIPNNTPAKPQASNYTQNIPAPAVQPNTVPQASPPQYIKPANGTNKVLLESEIRWCLRENIRIEAMRSVVNTNKGIGSFNAIVDDYNKRCASYRYYENAMQAAKRDVEASHAQIVTVAVQDANLLNQPPSMSNNIPKPTAQHTKEAQQYLITLGYYLGVADGIYGRKTADAVKAFQRDQGLTQDGWIDQNLLSILRQAISLVPE